MFQTKVSIVGMHCKACELLVEEELLGVDGVKSVQVSALTHQAVIETLGKSSFSEQEIDLAIQRAGYQIGETPSQPWLSPNVQIWQQTLLSGTLVLLVAWLIQKLGWWPNSFGQSAGQTSSLSLVLLLGITAGFSTCMALVGGLVVGAVAKFVQSHPTASFKEKLWPQIYFQVGRIGSFFLLGGLIALIGSVIQFTPLVLGLMTVGTGVIMLILGLQLTEIFPRLSQWQFSLPANLSRLIGLRKHQQAEYSPMGSFWLGAMTFFLPCGFTQAMQLLAMTSGSFMTGAAIMSVFALGTAPGLLGVGGLIATLKGSFGQRLFRFIGLVTVAMAVSNLINGYHLTGWTGLDKLLLSSSNAQIINQDGDVQEVRMIQNYGGYSPTSFTVKKNKKVRWIIDSQASESCASSIVMAKYGINTTLRPGENIFEFTPTSTGLTKFSCSMGMYTGTFNVID